MNHQLSGIALVKPALRRAEVERQIATAVGDTARRDVETDREVVAVTYNTSRFEPQRTGQYVVHGITDPQDSNSREALLVSEADDPDVKWLTIGLHMLASIEPVA